MSWKKNQ